MKAIKHFFLPHKGNGYHPHSIKLRSLAVVSVLLLNANLVNNYTINNEFKVLGFATNVSIGDLQVLTNQNRAANGLGGLALNSLLNSAAQNKAQHMLTYDYWSHTGPDGATPWTFINGSGYSYTSAGENLAFGFSTSSGVLTGWMNSPTHRANVLNSGFSEVGFGITSGVFQGEENTIVVAMYGTPKVITPPPEPDPPKVTPPASNPTNQSQPPASNNQTPDVSVFAPTPQTQTQTPVQTSPEVEIPDESVTAIGSEQEESEDEKIIKSENKTTIEETVDTEEASDKSEDLAQTTDSPGTMSFWQQASSLSGNWVFIASAAVLGLLLLTYLIRHTVFLHDLLMNGEKLIKGKPLLEIGIVYILFMFVLLSIQGHIV